jgi:hypothetical protein
MMTKQALTRIKRWKSKRLPIRKKMMFRRQTHKLRLLKARKDKGKKRNLKKMTIKTKNLIWMKNS